MRMTCWSIWRAENHH